MKEREYIFPEDIEPLVEEVPEKRSVTIKLFDKRGADNEGEENSKADVTQGNPAE